MDFVHDQLATGKKLWVLTVVDTGSQARAGVSNWMEFYNNRRPHKARAGRPSAVVYSLQIEATQPDQQEQIRA